MEKKNYKYYSYVKSFFSYINRAMIESKKLTLKQVSQKLRQLVNSYSGLNRDERYSLYKAGYEVARAAISVRRAGGDWQRVLSLRKNYDKVLRASRKVGQAQLRKVKLKSIRAMLDNPDQNNFVFFMCSAHTGCAVDHKPYQKQIFIDRFWRTKVSGARYRAIFSYIKNHKTMTVQDVMKEPAYLFTRPNCRHYLIPLKTSTVLKSSQRKVASMYLPPHHKELYTEKNYYHLRSEVYEGMDKVAPCRYYKSKARGH